MTPYGIVGVASLTAVLTAVMAHSTYQDQEPSSTQTPLMAESAQDQTPTRRLEATYESFPRGVQIFLPGSSVSTAAVGPRVAERALPRLPKGFSLGQATTRRVMTTGGGGAAATPGAAASPGKFVTVFPLQYQSVPLSKGTDYLAITTLDGRLLATRTRNVPTEVDATQPTVSPDIAVRIGREHARAALGAEEPTVTTPRLEVWVDAQRMGRLTWTFTVDSPSLVRPVSRQYWIRATGTPGIAAWENRIYHEHRGTVTASILQTPSTPADRPLANLGVNLLPGGVRVFTAEDGDYRFPSSSGKATVQSALGGISCVVQNVAGANMVKRGTGDGSSSIDLRFNATEEFELSQTSAYFWCNFAHAFTQLDTDALRQLSIRVNIASSCNAFYLPSDVSLNFFRAGNGCPNTAYADVVLHEYGHAADDEQGSILDRGYSEGFGDALAVLATRQSCSGRELFGPGTCLRDARDVVTWPPADEEPHAVGRIYAGFVWELVQQLSKRLSQEEAFTVATQLVLAAAAGNPSDVPDAVRLSILADDDDGDPSTCSPNFVELKAAAASRKIPIPPSTAPGTLEVLLKLSPTDDDGRFNLRFDGVTVKSNAGHGATTGARPISAGAHTVSQKGAFGTDLSEYQSFFDGGCAANGTVTVGSCLSQSCTLTNVRATGQNCQQQCRDERDQCFKEPEMTPAICVKLFKDCLASCNK